MPIEFGYFTIKVKDIDCGKAFYGAVFGWEFEDGHVHNTKFPLALAAGGPADIRFAYFQTPDLKSAVAKVIAGGGPVLERNTYTSGPNSICADDQGTVFALWQPAPGFE